MELNITLGIQILNFFMAWLLLHICYFKPAIQYMQAQQKAYDQMLEAIVIWQGRIAQKEQEAVTVWHDLSKFVHHHKPDIKREARAPIVYAEPNITRHLQQDVLVGTLKNILVTGISNVDL